ncbi:centrosomal protein of 104 kDa isoform X1 [Nycticebus coucang]|uniref:centrosomal protein of 104 kDa isoform X1 n=1 Tax=Nycticebus coucang TaxID=9470 RepID=UPI00234D8BB0|nr:centrosomal protein of 104 kDa isoform X1 [Nycticebus coucang]XP_053431417.1 centrosomal protein of 104 kDa isoform X1 [Nycticebus coucang]XP_053431418.1 centrosomal protein of 104 kDa isoform X1 [Nycticebus coucang]
MPHKIGFVVVSSSGHEDGFSARELMIHAPTVSGWRSPRFCQFPQEIVLQMVERCRIRKLQLLAHQYMISSKIEFYISESLPEYFIPYQAERFRRLGYVSLSDNEKTGCKARELKSVYVDAVGQFLKLIFHQNHINKYNIYNQVALVAINIIGDPADFSDESNIISREKLVDLYLGHNTEDPALEGTSAGKSDYISPLDDLAFDMYQDPEVAQIIRKLDERKREAVQKERYDYAKKLKQAIADLQKVGERLGRYEVEKRCAVEKEDYDLAKEKKQQMEQYRAQVYGQLELHSLLDAELMRRPFDLPPQPLVPSGSPGQRKPMPLLPQLEERGTENRFAEHFLQEKPSSYSLTVSPQHPAADQSLPATEPPPKTSVESLPYDERPLPAIRKQQGDTLVEPEMSDTDVRDAQKGAVSGEPEPLTEKALREASSAIDVLGETLVAGAYSKTWSYREDALLALYKQLMEMPIGTPKEDLKNLLRASIFLIQRAIKDIVSSVFQASLKLLKMIITQYIPKHRLSKLETTHCVERTIPILLTRTGDSSARLRVMAVNFIQEMALFKEVKSFQIIPSYLVQPLKANSSTHLAMSQMELLARLLRDLGTESSGFTVDNVMKFSVSALEHRVYEVRETAVRIILDMYKQHQAFVLEYLPPDDSNTRKNVLYKTIFEGFAKIDGRPTDAEIRAQKKAATEEAEKQKKEEIKTLQGQRAVLREAEANTQEKESDAVKPKVQDSQGRKAALPEAPAVEIPDSHYLDNLCIFCGERSESFTEEGLDLHYWKHCLMLARCEHCKQVVEISSLTEHLLTECDKKDRFGKCYRCSEAVLKEELPRHIKAKDCNPAKPEKLANRCPLCHENFTPGEEAWKAHLMGPAGCTMNLRKTHILQRAQALPGRGPPAGRPGPSASKMGSKIPTPKGGLSKSSGRTYTKR